jgi:radical SAM superfamily enzyme YgiQ (UPF0313 family)
MPTARNEVHMKILFVYPNVDTKNVRSFPYAIGCLSAFLKQHGQEAELLTFQHDIPKDALWSHIGNSEPDLIAFSTVTLQWANTRKYAAIIKEKFHVPVICGGVHPSFRPEEVIADANIDMVCIGEGEYALLEVMNRLENRGDLSTIPNIWVKNEAGTVFRNEPAPLIEDLDALPYPDRGLMPYQEVIGENRSEPILITSKGCPYNCTFCCNSAMKRLYKGKGKFLRQRSPDNVIGEIAALKEKYAFRSLNFYDEAFGYDPQWLKRFCEIYEREFRLPFGAMVRAETMDRETFRMMRKAGLELIYIGIESGNEEFRRDIMGRRMSNETLLQTCRDAQAEGIQIWTLNMVGVPGETPARIRDTMELNRRINPDFVNISIFQPFPGTQLYDECVKNNYIIKDYPSNLFDESILELPSISPEELKREYLEFRQLADEIRESHEEKGRRIRLVNI